MSQIYLIRIKEKFSILKTLHFSVMKMWQLRPFFFGGMFCRVLLMQLRDCLPKNRILSWYCLFLIPRLKDRTDQNNQKLFSGICPIIFLNKNKNLAGAQYREQASRCITIFLLVIYFVLLHSWNPDIKVVKKKRKGKNLNTQKWWIHQKMH